MAPKYPYGGSVSEGELYIDALRQVDADAEAARRLAEAATPAASNSVRVAGTNPGFLSRLKGLGGRALGFLGNPGVQGVADLAYKFAEGKPAREAIPEVAGGMTGSALAARYAPGMTKLPASIAGYFLGEYLGGLAAGQIEPDPQTRTGLGIDELQEMRDKIRAQAAEEPEVETRNPTPEVETRNLIPVSDPVATDYPEDVPPPVIRKPIDPVQGTLVSTPPMVPPDAAIVVGDEIVSEEPVREQGSAAALPGQSTTLSTPKAEGDDMQSELLKEAMTMRRAKEMAELGIYGGDQATTKGSKMYEWVRTHGDLADDLIRDKRMKEVRIARMFGRDLPTDAAGMDGQKGNFEAFEGMREMA